MLRATLMSDSATGFGLAAASMAVCGFVAHAKPALMGCSEEDLRRATVIGGIIGCLIALVLVFISIMG